MKNSTTSILVIGAILLLVAMQPGDVKQFKKTGATDVMFRTSDVTYFPLPGANIAFNLACDGSDLEQHNYLSLAASDTDCGGTLMIDNLPGTTVPGTTGTVTCVSSIALYYVGDPFPSYKVCCYGTASGSPTPSYNSVIYDEVISGTQSAVSSNPENEVMCAGEEPPPPEEGCSITFQNYVDYSNNWVDCGDNVC